MRLPALGLWGQDYGARVTGKASSHMLASHALRRRYRLIILHVPEFADEKHGDGVTHDVHGGPPHIHEHVDSCNDSDGFDGKTHRYENRRRSDQSAAADVA